MEAYFIPILTALIIFPFIALLLTIPYTMIQYRKYGSIPWLRSVLFYSFAFYLLCIYLLVILPLPSISAVSNLKTPVMQPIPFQFVRDFMRETVLDLKHPATWLPALKQNCFLQVIFNIFMFVPFGLYLNYYFNFSWKKIILSSFLLSLFFELTQLSGLYGIYPRSYRLFDVDDLILNTLGGYLGYGITPIFTAILPSKEAIDRKAYEKGKSISLGRRGIGFLIDSSILFLLALFHFWYLIPLYLFVLPYVTKGFTFGKWILKMRIVQESQKEPPLFYQYMIRHSLIYGGFFISFPIWIMLLMILILFSLKHDRIFFYEKLSHTTCISIIIPSSYPFSNPYYKGNISHYM